METVTTDLATLAPGREARARQIRGEQIRVVYRNLPLVLGGSVVVIGGMVFGLWNVVPNDGLVIWACAITLLTVSRVGLYWWYRRAAPDPISEAWGRIFALGSAVSGVLWGALGVFLFPLGSLEYQLFILFVLVALGASAISSLTAYMPAFYAYFPVSMLPISVVMIRLNDPIHIALGVMTVAYVVVLSFFGRTMNKTLTETLTLRFENVDLVRELSAQRDEAERANVSKSKFLAAASHDLRQPLHALTLFASALDERIRYPEVRKIVDNINASVRALEKLFNALLDISRLDAGVLQPEVRDFRLQESFARMIAEFAPEAEAKKLALTGAAGDVVVRSDPALLERILRNYLSNAVRYTERGGIAITCAPHAGQVRIEVADSGIGIPAAQHREIFDEFHQLGNPERDREKGLGLGLAIVDRVARLLGHPIEVESAPGEGSRFSVTVPLGDARRIAAEGDREAALAGGDLAGVRAVVVDDEIGVRDGMRTLLEQWGCEVAVAGSEDEAIDAANRLTGVPDAVIVDYRLRDGRTGVEAVARLNREFERTIPALIVTGDTAAERLREAKASGYQLVHKPVQPAMLRAFLRNARGRGRIA